MMRLAAIAFLCIAAHAAASAQPPQPDARAKTPVTWIIVVDDLHLDFRNTGRIRDMLKTIVKELIQDGDHFAIVSSGPSTLAVDVTADRQLLADAIRKTTGNALKYEDIQTANSADEVRYRASIAVETAQSILSNASRLPTGPKAMLFFYVTAQITSLRSIADKTSGFAIVDGYFEDQLRRVAEAMRK